MTLKELTTISYDSSHYYYYYFMNVMPSPGPFLSVRLDLKRGT